MYGKSEVGGEERGNNFLVSFSFSDFSLYRVGNECSYL